MEPKVSIIIPVYKVEKYLRKCLDSVINQTLKDIEIIIVDEGDMDECRKIIDEYEAKDNRITTIHEYNGGLSNARNRALKEVHSKYVIFVDSDDWISEDMAEILYNDITESNADFVICGTYIHFTNFGKSFVRLNQDDINYFKIDECGLREVRNNDFGKINVAAWNKIFKKSLIDKYNIKFPENLYYEDAGFFWIYMAVSKNVYLEPRKLYNYLRRDGSLMMQTFSRKFDKKTIDHLKIVELFYDFLVSNNLYEKYYEAFWNCFKISVLMALIYAADDKYAFLTRKYISKFLSDKNLDKTKNNYGVEYWNKCKNLNDADEFYTKELSFNGFPLIAYKYNSKVKKVVLFNFIPLFEIKGEFKDVQQYKNFNYFTNL